MLLEIYCEKFKQKRINFKNGLNVILGTSQGDNSIGKSTFLLVIDFVLGGDTYSNSNDIIRNVGEHDIFFTFSDNNTNLYFARNNINSNVIWKCDNNYNKLSQMDIAEYREWLRSYYKMELPSLSFRDSVGRYSRIYGKDNYNEKRPLQYSAKENDKKTIYALLKLFNQYLPIQQIEIQATHSSEALKAFKKAQILSYIENIGKRDYDRNNKELALLEKELKDLAEKLDSGLIDLDSVITEQALEIKTNLSKARRLRGSILSRLDTINENLNYKFSINENSFVELKKYFPNVNLEELEKIERFHSLISEIFKEEIKEQKNQLNKDLIKYNTLINELEEKLKSLIKNPNLSKNILQKHSELLKKIEKIRKENSTFEKLEQLKKQKEQDEARLTAIESEQLSILSNSINIEMSKINDYVYSGEFNAPIINFENGNYTFITPNDTGTGIAYKGLIVFDLAIMNLTQLPILIHDSIILKQISDEAIEKLLELYISKQNKQIFIALDKADSYTEKSKLILSENKVLALAPNGNELFGYSWGKKKYN